MRKFTLGPANFWVGFAAQSPGGDSATARFTDFHYGNGPVNLWSVK